MASGLMALGDAKSGHDVDPMLRPNSRLAFRRPGRQTHGAHRTQGIIFADEQDQTFQFGSLLCWVQLLAWCLYLGSIHTQVVIFHDVFSFYFSLDYITLPNFSPGV